MSEWGPWIDHDGRGRPVPRGAWVQGVNLKGFVSEGLAGLGDDRGWRWLMPHPQMSVVRYRVMRPRGMEIIDAILADVEMEPA